MADWVTGISKYQTANLLTPLPATSNWSGLVPLDADGNELAEGQMRPYHLYTGRQLVYKDERWSMQESRVLFDRYHAKLSPVDKLYERVFRLMRSPRFQVSGSGKELNGTISARINEFSEVLRTLSDSSKELPEALSSRMHEMSVALGKYRTQLASTGKEVPEVISARVSEAGEALKKYRQQIAVTGREISETVALRINEVSETLMSLSDLSRKAV
jgi:hypothetical protein